MSLGFTWKDLDDLTIGEMYDLISAQVTSNLEVQERQEELARERKEEELYGRWANSPADFALLSLGGA